jgi:hypothetical protein
MTFDKERLFKARLTEADVDVEGLGTVRVRALSRAEVLRVRSAVKGEEDAIKRQADLERKMLALAMVDPELTEAEVGQWQAASTAGEMEPVTDKVQELSGLLQGAAKEAYVEFEQNPDAEFRLPPSGRAEHDRGPDAGGDE